MYLEALIRLADIIENIESRNEVLFSEKYHKETRELIEHLSKSLINELEFKEKNPGPYKFGFGKLELEIYSPDHTEKQEWTAIARTNKTQLNYRFNSLMGIIDILSKCIKQINEDEPDSIKKED